MDFAAFAQSAADSFTDPSTPFGVETELMRVQNHWIAPQPFAWQNGDQLLLLDRANGEWQFAELRFLREECRYEEVRRASYRWQREAIGVLLSRALLNGDEALIDTVEQLDEYLSRNYQTTIINC